MDDTVANTVARKFAGSFTQQDAISAKAVEAAVSVLRQAAALLYSDLWRGRGRGAVRSRMPRLTRQYLLTGSYMLHARRGALPAAVLANRYNMRLSLTFSKTECALISKLTCNTMDEVAT